MRLTPRQLRIKEFLIAVLIVVFIWTVKSCIATTL